MRWSMRLTAGARPYCMPLSTDAVYGMAINVVWRCAKPLTCASPLPPASLPRAVCTRRSWGGTVAGHGRRPGGHRANMWSAALPRARGGSRHHIPRRAGGLSIVPRGGASNQSCGAVFWALLRSHTGGGRAGEGEVEPAGIRPEEAVSGPPFSSTGRTSNTPPRRLSTTRVRPWESAAPDLPQLYRLGVALWGALSGVGVLGGGGRGGRGAGGGGSLITSCRCRVAQLRNDRLQGEAAEHPRGEYGISLTSTFYYGSPAATVEQVRPLRGAVARYGARLVGTRAPVTHALGGGATVAQVWRFHHGRVSRHPTRRS